jgi:asparagine synthase (glutamine-hydrolysing)
MCGIAGFVDLTAGPEVAAARLNSMLDRIRHRGPDGDGHHFDAPAGLAVGMRRLSIIDLEGGGQPIWNEDQTVGVVFNGEIYNYVELTRRLEGAGHRFRTQSDTEVLVHLYEVHGVRMLDHLRGMFAFALYDKRKRVLLLARDHFGQKPLYYSLADDGRFAFASEIKALLALPFISREFDSGAFLDFVSWFSLPSPLTHFKGILKLPAGSYLLVPLAEPRRAVATKFWTFEAESPPSLLTMDDAVTALDAALRDSVAIHLRADVPLGVLLSSGLDSRTITAYAQELQDGRMSTFTVGFPGDESEAAGAEATAKELNSRHYSIVLDHRDLEDEIGTVAWHLDEPIGDEAAFAVLKVARLASDHVKVLLSGEGADELFAGYAGRYQGMLQQVERTDQLRKWGALLPRTGEAYPPGRWGRLRRRAHSSPGSELIRMRVEGLPGDVTASRGLTPERLRRLASRQDELAAHLLRPQPDLLTEMTSLDMDWQMAESLLLKADKMSMAASIELRCPFLDSRVTDVSRRLHPALKMGPTGPGKLVLRECLSRKLHEGMDRPKKGFPIPTRVWLRGPLRDVVGDRIFAKDSAVLSELDPGLLRAAWEEFQRGENRLERVFYALWLYEVWRRVIVSLPRAS